MTWLKITSDDPGAPALLPVNGSLPNVFRWALPQLGFDLEFGPTGNAAVFRASTGNRFRLHINSTDVATYGSVIVRGAETATSATALGSPFPTTSQHPNTQARWNAADIYSGTTPNDYVFYSTGKFVVFLIKLSMSDPDSWTFNYFGDIPTKYAGGWATVISTIGSQYQTNYPLADSALAYPGPSEYIFWARGINATTKSTKGSRYGTGGICAVSNTPATRAGYMNRLQRQKIGINCSGSATGSPNSNFALACRGWLPNIWSPFHSSWAGSPATLDTFTDTAYNPSAVFKWYGYNTSAGFIIEETDTWQAPT